ncbi:glycosyltransferase [Limisphaera sp. VF-2]|uniref:glycosyltransferase n=1 Tax=Limisphaera sp. VF-2 TaxID=3400418 RepID=UPI003C2ECE91
MPQPRPHLLFIAYHFPPHRTVACHRSRNLAKHLALLGWKVTVLTLDESVWQRVDDTISDFRDIDKDILRVLRVRPRLRWLNTDQWRQFSPKLTWWAGAPFRRLCRPLGIELSIGWIPSALRAAQSLDTDPPHIVLATGGPFLSSFYLANRLARRWNVPYVLDYRDLWTTGNPHNSSRLSAWQTSLERRYARHASLVVAVSDGLADNLQAHLHLARRPEVITNGYDPEVVARVDPTVFPEPAVVYAGTLYPPLRTLDPLLAALRLLDLDDLPWRFHYYGLQAHLVQSSARLYSLAHRVTCYGEALLDWRQRRHPAGSRTRRRRHCRGRCRRH